MHGGEEMQLGRGIQIREEDVEVGQVKHVVALYRGRRGWWQSMREEGGGEGVRSGARKKKGGGVGGQRLSSDWAEAMNPIL